MWTIWYFITIVWPPILMSWQCKVDWRLLFMLFHAMLLLYWCNQKVASKRSMNIRLHSILNCHICVVEIYRNIALMTINHQRMMFREVNIVQGQHLGQGIAFFFRLILNFMSHKDMRRKSNCNGSNPCDLDSMLNDPLLKTILWVFLYFSSIYFLYKVIICRWWFSWQLLVVNRAPG